MVSRVQAIATYDGPMISGMLMFTKGDIATLMMKVSPSLPSLLFSVQ